MGNEQLDGNTMSFLETIYWAQKGLRATIDAYEKKEEDLRRKGIDFADVLHDIAGMMYGKLDLLTKIETLAIQAERG